ncbi:hypothetical protein K466DRAFT_604857 [Polyporus arcularius HHB13444]|uniref:Uncharacterized protein n=1 Tax=Polyporus arcularius HHB13444 TaxID=1314778 RepID=A0A5C3P5E4_9APHY|nr:hypothetical protein K466DRAFT_604857 [Polyporus arcularius HHB13444]
MLAVSCNAGREHVRVKKRARIQDKVSDWKECEDHYWIAFKSDWWGDAGKSRLLESEDSQNIITVTQSKVLVQLDILTNTNGQLYVRAEYELLYARLCNAASVHMYIVIPGVVLTGQPGSGKSCFGLYALLRCIANEQAVVFFTTYGQAFYFNESGVRTCPTAEVNSRILLRRRRLYCTPGTRMWSLMDAPAYGKLISPKVLSHSIFFGLLASTDPSSFEVLLEHSHTRQYIMNPWADSELLVVMTTPGMMYAAECRAFDLAEVQKVRAQAGPCPSDVAAMLRDAEHVREGVQSTVRPLSMKNILEFALATWSRPSIGSFKALLMRRVGDLDPQALGDDVAVLTFKTAYVMELVRARYRELVLEDVGQVSLNACAGNTEILAALLFEGLAFKVLSSDAWEDVGRFRGYARMSRTTTSCEKSLRLFEF